MNAGEKIRHRFVIVGATSCIAVHCIELWLKSEDTDVFVFLIGRNEGRLKRVANDLIVRFPKAKIEYITVDLCNVAMIQKTINYICESQLPTTVLIAHGAMPKQIDCEKNINICRGTLEINAISPVLWAEAFVDKIQNIQFSRLVLIGSVAGDRGRQANYIYGAAKGLLEHYAHGLRHRLVLNASTLKVTLVKPGPTATPMTAHLLNQGYTLAPVSIVAQAIVGGVNEGVFILYTPKKWKFIMGIIRLLPDWIFNRLRI